MNTAYALLVSLETWKNIGGILLAIVILLAMVTIHEFGHYVAGKILGFKITEFSVGFGLAIFKKRSKKTGELFALRVIPLGGYCAFDGEDDWGDEEKKEQTEEDDEDEEEESQEPFSELKEEKKIADGHTVSEPNVYIADGTEQGEKEGEVYPIPKGAKFNDQAPWKRIIVLIAGATMNYLLALVLIVVMFTALGRPTYLVKEIEKEESAAQTAVVLEEENDAIDPMKTILPGDCILSVNGRSIYLATDFITALSGRKQGETLDVVVYRQNASGVGEELGLQITLRTDATFKSMNDYNAVFTSLGLDDYALHPEAVKEGFFASFGHSFGYSVRVGGVILRSLGELLTGKISIKSMGGPVTTIKVASEAATSGLQSFLNIASFIGVNLAVFNLLPIPALDGSKVVFCIIEWIRKKPINRKVETIIHFVGIVALFAFAILVDLLQFVG